MGAALRLETSQPIETPRKKPRPQLFADASGRFLAMAAVMMSAYTSYEQGGDAVTIVKAAVIGLGPRNCSVSNFLT